VITKKFKKLILLTFPILLGYVSVGFVFGVVARGAGLDLWYSVLISIVLYAGAAQFLLVRLIQNASPIFEIGLAIFLLNLRHIFYYRPIQNKVPKSGPMRWYTVSAMSDETFAVLTEADVTPKETFLVALINQCYWVFGTFLGALCGDSLAQKISGLEFSLVALFTVLFVEKLKWKSDAGIIALCTAICIFVRYILPPSFFLIAAMAASIFMLVSMEKKNAA
jgi:4-azaleucine resistance transporter AzlC